MPTATPKYCVTDIQCRKFGKYILGDRCITISCPPGTTQNLSNYCIPNYANTAPVIDIDTYIDSICPTGTFYFYHYRQCTPLSRLPTTGYKYTLPTSTSPGYIYCDNTQNYVFDLDSQRCLKVCGQLAGTHPTMGNFCASPTSCKSLGYFTDEISSLPTRRCVSQCPSTLYTHTSISACRKDKPVDVNLNHQQSKSAEVVGCSSESEEFDPSTGRCTRSALAIFGDIVVGIHTTSKLLTTGIDAKTCKVIVLDQNIQSMTEFKQIIGRGTRTFDGKDFFTIYDFVRAYQHFNDPEWDGEPLPPDEPAERGRPKGQGQDPPPGEPSGGTIGEPPDPTERIVVKLADGKERSIRYIASTTYWSHDGRPITAQEFMDQLFGDLGTLVASEDELRAIWSDPARRSAFIQRLIELGYDADRIEDMRRLIDAPNSDIFDVLAYVRFTLAPLTRSQRAEAARSTGLSGYEPEMREFLDYVLRAYEAHGIAELAPIKIADFLRIRYGGTNDAKRHLGPVPAIRDAFVGIQAHLFR